MNANRRKRIKAINDKLCTLVCDVQAIKDEEQEYLDNMPESLQGGDKAEAAEAAITALDEVVTDLEELMSDLDEAAAEKANV